MGRGVPGEGTRLSHWNCLSPDASFTVTETMEGEKLLGAVVRAGRSGSATGAKASAIVAAPTSARTADFAIDAILQCLGGANFVSLLTRLMCCALYYST